ncbi:MAG: HDOD domain-containing protein, partial [Mariprofundaceae bacterium]
VSDHFVAGLLHDFGKAVLVQYEPRMYADILKNAATRQIPLAEAEREATGLSNAEVGAMLAESWQLPEALVECIRDHVDCHADSPDMIISVAAANHVVKFMQLGSSGNPVGGEFPDFMKQRLGCNVQDVAAQMARLPDEVSAMQNMVRG